MPETADERWIGPYRVLRPLGRGGMGEVVLAQDPRLGRRVAIKRVLSMPRGNEESSADARRRSRFRREARLLAKLRHPAIVQVFELLAVDGEDHLVMEHVDGPTLREALGAQGTLPATEVVTLGARIARGLAHAHAHGIIHRDLKTENVLLDADGEPRIADFGLACSDPAIIDSERIDPEGDATLTAPGRVLGTARAMAPEQLTGERVDARSDLFSLGVLLVELLTGVSPFEASTRRETAARILSRPPTIAPSCPPALRALIEHLLEKEPVLRPRSAADVARRLESLAGADLTGTSPAGDDPEATLVATESTDTVAAAPSPGRRRRHLATVLLALVVAALVVWATARRQRPPPTIHVVVASPRVEAPDPDEAELLRLAIRSAAQRGLGALRRVVVLGPGIGRPDDDATSPRDLVRATSADQVLTSEARCARAECWLELARVDGASGEILWSKTLQAPRAEPQTLAWATEVAVAGSDPTRQPRDAEARPMPPELIAELLALQLPSHQSVTNVDPATTLQRLDDLEDRYGSHLELELWTADVARRAFVSSLDPPWLDRALQALDRARRLAPEDPRVGLTRIDVLLDAGRVDDAGKAIDELDGLIRGDARLVEREAQWLEAQGRFDDAVAAMERAVDRRPSWARWVNLAKLATRAGRIERAREALDAADRLVPGTPVVERRRAMIELLYGDLDRAAELFGHLAADASDLGALNNLGVTHLLRRDASRALEAFETAHELAPSNRRVLLNLADTHELAGRTETARAFALRVTDSLGDSTALGSPTDDVESRLLRAQALTHLGDAPGAISEIEGAVRSTPEDPMVRFVASLVYARVGDLASGERNRQRALELGLEARWFDLPVFDVLGPARIGGGSSDQGRM